MFAAVGALAACVHFLLLARNVRALLHGTHPVRTSILQLGRIPLTAAAFAWAASQGACPLAAALAGFLAARWLFLRDVEILFP
jgi:hypothetical protein